MNRESYYKKDLSSLYKLAQDYFNRWIRLRDPFCITCRRDTEEAGHFEHGGNNKYSFWCDFNPKNMNGQCTHCNHYGRGMLNIYAEKLIKMYGPEVIEELNMLKWKSEVWGKEDLINIIEECKFKILGLKNGTSDV